MNQISFESFLKPRYVIDKPVRLIELFAGIGSQAKALERLGVDFEKYIISEWEVEAIRSYKAIHFNDDNTDYSKDLNQKQLISVLYEMGISSDGKELLTLKQVARHNEKWLRSTYNNIKATHNIVNITNAKGSDLKIIDTDKFCYILTYSFPCQDLSLAGKQRGMSEGGQTRSGLLWEVKRLLYECEELPQVLLMENVTQVHSKKNAENFNKWIDVLSDLGYSNYFADLNAKNYGVPQNRNRTFMISILGDYYYEFPEPFKLQKRLRDILETNVDKKYYLSSKVIVGFEKHNKRHREKGTGFIWKPKTPAEIACCIRANGALAPTDNTIIEEVIGSTQKNAYVGTLDGVCPTLTTAMGEGGGQIPMIRQIAQLYPDSGNPQAGRIYDVNGISCAVDTSQGGNRMPKIAEIGDSIDINYPNSNTRKGRIQKQIAHTVGCQNNSNAVIVDDTFGFDEKPRIYKKIVPALRSERNGLKVIEEPVIAASRGRNIDNPSDRRAGIELEQRLEIKIDGTSNTLTTIQKDNLVVEPAATNNIKIRRLTPKECLRLMTFDDTDYEKIKAAGVVDTNIYKQAGNSIVVDVLAYIFASLFDKEYIKNE